MKGLEKTLLNSIEMLIFVAYLNMSSTSMTNKTLISAIEDEIIKLERKLSPENKDLVQNWDALVAKYKN